MRKIDKVLRSDNMYLTMMTATFIAGVINKLRKTKFSAYVITCFGSADIILGAYGMTRDAMDLIMYGKVNR